MKNYGDILKGHRLARGLTLKDIEKATGINNGNLSRWERGEVLPNIDFCVQLANFYGLSVDELLGLTDEGNIKIGAPLGDSMPKQTMQEEELLSYFRELSPYLKGVALDTVRAMAGGNGGSLQNKA